MSYTESVEAIIPVIAANAHEADKGHFPSASIDALRTAGLLAPQTLPAAAYVVERIARVCGSTAMILTMHYAATAVIEAHGPADVKKAIAAGKHLTTLAFSEPGSRSHFWAALGTAVADGDGVRINSKKSWVTSASHADSVVWSTKPVAGTEMSTLWLVPKGLAGVRVDGGFDGLGLRGNDSRPMAAEGAHLPNSARLGDDGAGFGIMMGTVLPWFNVLSASVSAGLMEGAVEATAKHAAGTQFAHAGSGLADLPTVRAFIARMRIKTDQTKALNGDTLAAMGASRPDTMLRVLESKAAAGEAAAEVTDLAMRVCGGVAFRKDVGVERIFRDARAALVMGPTTDVLYDFIGKAVCGLPLF
jgi:alkylation response protein AidB-like acyl-CoA dehydrogenase